MEQKVYYISIDSLKFLLNGCSFCFMSMRCLMLFYVIPTIKRNGAQKKKKCPDAHMISISTTMTVSLLNIVILYEPLYFCITNIIKALLVCKQFNLQSAHQPIKLHSSDGKWLDIGMSSILFNSQYCKRKSLNQFQNAALETSN